LQSSTWRSELFLLLWAGLIFAFFSFSKSKLIPYILPVIPPLAILTAHYLHDKTKNAYRPFGNPAFLCLIVIALAFAYIFFNFTHHNELPNALLAQKISLLAAALMVSGACISYLLSFYNFKKAIINTILFSALFLICTIATIPYVDTRSILPLANILKTRIKPDDIVVTYNQYYQDLPFYLNRKVSILNWRNELAFGMQFQDTSDWMLDDASFMKRWHGPKTVYVIMLKPEFEGFKRFHPSKEIKVLGTTTTNVLITNSTT
jgi:4-amino-4-deoxy-L-arabinose transferase-like glycosyltransferase